MIQIIAFIYAGDLGREGIRQYESKALPLLTAHGGRLISASSRSASSTPPCKKIHTAMSADEVHVIQFPSPENFNAYKNDKRHQALLELKAACISRVELHITDVFHQY